MCPNRLTMTRSCSEQGFALLFVLWTVVLLALIASHIGLTGRMEARTAQNILILAQTEAAADGGVYQAIFRLSAGPDDGAQAVNYAQSIRVGSFPVRMAIEDEAGKINPNFASRVLFEALLVCVGEPGERARIVAQNIIDWRGGEGARTLNSVVSVYREAGLPYRPPQSAFRAPGELGLVLGVRPELLSALLAHVSVYNPEQPDPAKADPIVACALRHAAAGRTGATSVGGTSTFRISAKAAGPDNAEFTRAAVVRIGPNSNLPRGYAIITWEQLSNEDVASR